MIFYVLYRELSIVITQQTTKRNRLVIGLFRQLCITSIYYALVPVQPRKNTLLVRACPATPAQSVRSCEWGHRNHHNYGDSAAGTLPLDLISKGHFSAWITPPSSHPDLAASHVAAYLCPVKLLLLKPESHPGSQERDLPEI